jgi:glycosyltransferase involved in cell wall biosynthesis
MRILFDHQTFQFQKFGGVSRYYAELIHCLSKKHNIEIAIKYSDNQYLKEKKLVPIKPLVNHREDFMKGIEFIGKGRVFNLLKAMNPSRYYDCNLVNREFSIDLLKKQNFDIFHPTYYDNYFLEYLGNKPFVLTIHDMVHELYPEMIIDPELIKSKAELAEKASHIIAVSENTKKDIIEILGIPETKISVIYHANSLNKEIVDSCHPAKAYLLYIGARSFYKNFMFFSYAIEPLLKANPQLFIICTGEGFDDTEIKCLQRLKIFNQFISRNVNDTEMTYLYKNAIGFVFPSYYEGFGIPILEAFTMECPVILSNSSCFKEIAGDAAVYFNPKNRLSIRTEIERIISDVTLRQSLIKKGLERISHFSWERSAEATINIYLKLCN